MNKKIMIFCVSAVFMLIAISFASAVNTNEKNASEKESPLYRIRAKSAVREKIGEMIDSIKTNFLGERIFFVPFFRFMKREPAMPRMATDYDKCTWNMFTCVPPCP
jgi:hypothetical protein